ncbi:MAG: hypothetical protein RM049_17920 [Nostoc sp. DedQUE04]|uniref:hypothetical protein n=1 Tax=Nostoc sp. DedQUE04 TaxID=3075390 RepID=UPI002AD32C04|nr:hypothetical protein [Nostoc sp. DedQUE04]MDZ8137155.1 hypothetical protein [Nostoc sp. DedQUE04]
MTLNYVPRVLMAHEDVLEKAANMTSSESNEINAVEVDGVRFETLVPERILCLPKQNLVQKLLSFLEFLLPMPLGYFSPKYSVQIGIRITNNTSTPFRFSFYFTFFPELVNANGPIPLEGGWISLLSSLESDYPLAMPGESLTFFPNIEIFWIWGNQFGISIPSANGGKWFFQPLKLGNYQFRFIYNNQNEKETTYSSVNRDMSLIEGIWTGEVLTPFVELHLAQF